VTTDFTELPDLAAEASGGAVLFANDEFFAEKESLLRAHAPEWREHAYTDRGKWMDGWETRRRREPGHDFCVIRLGLPGVIHGVVVDTKWFRGNFPESCALEGCAVDAALDLAALERAEWFPLLPRSPLAGDRANPFPVAAAQRVTHVRLSIFPDGGVARLRVHGEVAPDWARLTALGGPLDLAALEHGGRVLAASDMFFGNRQNLIKPGRPFNMSDGWETKRRRGPGHDWALVELGARGSVERLELDTTHFKGNAPGRATLEGSRDGVSFRPLLATPVQPHTRHVFERELRRLGPISHVRLSVFPDGGVARLRVMGYPQVELEPGLARLAALPAADALAALTACCGAHRWAEALAARRPFTSRAELLRVADAVWWQLDEADWLEAFAAHPQIGESPRGAGAHARWSAGEQARAQASPVAATALAEANRAYRERFGFIYIVCAQGRGAEELLADVTQRLDQPREVEVRTAAEEQAQITRLRLGKLITEAAP
jgi:allantoicase